MPSYWGFWPTHQWKMEDAECEVAEGEELGSNLLRVNQRAWR